MQDHDEKQAADLHKTANARRQAEYAAKQRGLGRRQRSFWLTDEEARVVGAFVQTLRDTQN